MHAYVGMSMVQPSPVLTEYSRRGKRRSGEDAEDTEDRTEEAEEERVRSTGGQARARAVEWYVGVRALRCGGRSLGPGSATGQIRAVGLRWDISHFVRATLKKN